MRKRIVSILLILCVALCFVPYSISADADVAETVIFSAVGGTETNFNEGISCLVDGKKTEANHSKWCVTGIADGAVVSAVIEASERIVLTGYKLYTANDTEGSSGRNPKNWTLSACNDYNAATGSGTWVVLDTVTDDTTMPNANYTGVSFAVDGNSTYYQYYKLDVTALQDGNILQLEEIEFDYTQCSHTWSAYSAPVAATCTSEGYVSRSCSGACGTVQVVKTTPALGHDFGGSSTGACLHTGCTETAANYFSGWTVLTSSRETVYKDGKYYLTEDIEITHYIDTMALSYDAQNAPIIDLNGHVINYKGAASDSVIKIQSASDGLTIQDSSPSVSHKFKVREDGLYVWDETNGTTIVYGGCITSGVEHTSRAAFITFLSSSENTVITLNGGNLIGGYTSKADTNDTVAGAIWLFSDKTRFIMNGGAIIGCKAPNGTADAIVSYDTPMFANGGIVDGTVYITSVNVVRTTSLTTTHFLKNILQRRYPNTGDKTNDWSAGIFYGQLPQDMVGNKVTFKRLDGTVYAVELVKTGDKAAEPLSPTSTATTWYTASGEAFNFATSRISSDITLYAGVPTFYDVTFKNGDVTVDTDSVLSGSKLTAPTGITPPTGCELAGWYTDSAYTTKWEFDTNTVQSTVTLYARWRSTQGPTLPDLVDNKVYTCGEDLKFSVGGDDIASVKVGTTPLTIGDDDKYTIEAGSGTVTVTVTDIWNRSASKTITVRSSHNYGDYQKNAEGHWRVCGDCGDEETHEPHTPDRAAATYDDPITCQTCSYEITPKLVDNEAPVIDLVSNKVYTCGTDVEFSVTDNGTLANVKVGTTPLTAGPNGKYKIEAGSGNVIVIATDAAGNTASKTITVKSSHNYGNWKFNAELHWKECSDCGDETYILPHTPNYPVATTEHGQNCTLCGYEIAKRIIAPITRVTVVITPPEIGRDVYSSETIPLYTSDPSDTLVIYYCQWYRLRKEYYTGTVNDAWQTVYYGDKFVEGYYYYAEICFVPEEGYTVDKNITGKINGREHYDLYGDIYGNWGGEQDYVYMAIVFDPLVETRKVITDVSATVTAPVIGETPDYEPTFTTTPADGLTLEVVSWYKMLKDDYTGTADDDWSLMDSDEAFAAGYIYSCDMYFSINEGYLGNYYMRGTVNGRPHVDAFGRVYDDDYDDDEVYLSIAFDSEVALTEAAATITAPVIGATPDIAPTITTNIKDALTLKRVRWYKMLPENYMGNDDDWMYWDGLETGEKFQEGYRYSCCMTFNIADGVIATSAIKGTVNGKAHDDTFEDIYDEDNGTVFLAIVFDVLGEAKTSVAIDEININVTAPAVGALPVKTPTLTPTKGLTIENFSWGKIPIADYDPYQSITDHDISNLAENETFSADYIYLFGIDLEAEMGYKISNDVTIKVNGKVFNGYTNRYGSVYLYIIYAFDDSISDITNVAATVTAPVLGATPDYDPIVTATPAGSIQIGEDDISWMKIPVSLYTGSMQDRWMIMSNTETFASGFYYALSIRITPKKGYVIPNTITGTINGKAFYDMGTGLNTLYRYNTLTMVFDPLPATGLSAIPNNKFTLNGYTLDSNIADVTLTPDTNNIGIEAGFSGTGYAGYYIISSGGTTIEKLLQNLYYPEHGAKFTYNRNYYLLVAVKAQEGYDITTLIAGKVELEGYGNAERIEGDGPGIFYIVFKLPQLAEPTETITVPFKTQIDLGGDAAPGKTTFELEIFDPEYMLWLYYPDFECTAEIEIDGEGTFNGTLTITGPKSQIEDFKQCGSLFVRQAKGTDDKWTYSDDVYYLWYENPALWRGANEDGADDAESVLHIYKAQYGAEGYELIEEDADMLFKNTYTANAVTPETGDGSNVVLWIALLMLSGIVIAGTGAYQKKKRCVR